MGAKLIPVWRFETDDGSGPYQSQEHGYHCPCLLNPERWPPPDVDWLMAIKWDKLWLSDEDDPSRYLFGFRTRTQARRWFNSSTVREMAEHGIRLSLYCVPVDAVIIGEKQVAFRSDQAKWKLRL
jgi:hypothetical protein